VESTTALLNLS